MNAVSWNYYNKFNGINDKYLLASGEGDNKATQIVTAVNKLIYKWYNDGDVFDNTYCLSGWWNDLSSYANWLHTHTDEETKLILERMAEVTSETDYEYLLKDLADHLLDNKALESYSKQDKISSVYDCVGVFKYEEPEDEEDDEEDDDWYY